MSLKIPINFSEKLFPWISLFSTRQVLGDIYCLIQLLWDTGQKLQLTKRWMAEAGYRARSGGQGWGMLSCFEASMIEPSLSISLALSIYLHFSHSLSILSLSLSISISFYISLCICIFTSSYLSISLFISLSIYLYRTYLSFFIYLAISISSSISL